MTGTQSVCKHCGKAKDHVLHASRFLSSHDFESVAEPASTGEPPPKKRMMQKPYGGEIHEECQDYRGVCTEYVEAARPSEPAAPKASTEPQPLPCRTPGAVYHFKLAHSEQSGREILALHVYMPQEISIAEEQAQSIEEKLHDACEAILSAYWPNTFAAAPQPVSGDAPECTCNNLPHYWNCHTVLRAAAPKVEEIARKIMDEVRRRADNELDNMGAAEYEAILRPYFPPASTAQTTPAHFSDCDYDCSCGWKKDPDSHLGAVRD